LKTTPDEAALLREMTRVTVEAGRLAEAWFRAGAATSAAIESKHGGSPVTKADFAVDRFLRPALAALAPDAGWLSEETTDTDDRLSRRRVFVVDPIDGTRAFIKGDPRWAVSVALVDNGSPVLAALHLPALSLTFAAVAGGGATLNGQPVRASSRGSLEGARLAGPPRLLESLKQAGLAFEAAPRVPSLAYRLAMVCHGALDASLASTDSHDWDIAASDLLLRESGARLADLQGRAPVYNAVVPRHGVLTAAPLQIEDELRGLLLQGSKHGKADAGVAGAAAGDPTGKGNS